MNVSHVATTAIAIKNLAQIASTMYAMIVSAMRTEIYRCHSHRRTYNAKTW